MEHFLSKHFLFKLKELNHRLNIAKNNHKYARGLEEEKPDMLWVSPTVVVYELCLYKQTQIKNIYLTYFRVKRMSSLDKLPPVTKFSSLRA